MTTLREAQAHSEPPTWLAEVTAIVGGQHATVGFADRLAYSRDRWPMANAAFRDGGIPTTLPAAIVRPGTYDEVAAILRWANGHDVAVVPFGLGSGVLGGALPVEGCLTLDTRRLDRVLSINREDCLVTVEAGANGGHIEAALNKHGLTIGHYPQSLNISTVGGWIACRGSGQASSRYGSIESMLAGMKVVLADGTPLEIRAAPRHAAGPSLTELFLGSEGTLGVIVEATLRVLPLPEHEIEIAVAFPDHSAGLLTLRRVIQSGIRPLIARLYDEAESEYRLRGHDAGPNRALALLVFGGLKDIAEAEAGAALTVASEAGGRSLGPTPVETWKRLRFDSYSARHMAAGRLMDTVEVSLPWSKLDSAHEAAKAAVEAIADGTHFGAHWSHLYPDGACMYSSIVLPEAVLEQQGRWHAAAWEAVMRAAGDAGGSVAHHHGVGRHRSRWLVSETGAAGLDVLRAVKRALDPNGIMNPGKILPEGDE